MSIAYGFEPDVSPIYEDDDDNPRREQSVHFSSADTPKKTGRPSFTRHQRTMGTTHLFDESSFHNFHQECAPEADFRSEISEIVPDSTVNYVEPSDEVVPDSRDGRDEVEVEEDETVPDSTGFLSDTFIVLSAGCCIPIKQHLTKLLVEMGANMQPEVDHRTTHIIVDRYADESDISKAMKRTPRPPLMVDVKWIQECVDRREKCEETDYSMRDCRYLKQTCRRLSSYREPTPLGQDIDDVSIEWMDMENETEGPESPTELLEQIKKLSERLDALLNYVPIIRFEYHSPDCPTRSRPAQFIYPPVTQLSPIPARIPSKTVQKLQNLFKSISTSGQPIRRRRSFTGFHLEHREPENPVHHVHLASRDERKTWEKGQKAKIGVKAKKTATKTRKAVRKPGKPGKSKNSVPSPPKKRGKPVPVRADDSDIQSALASLTISSPPRLRSLQKQGEVSRISTTTSSVEIVEVRRREPLVVTRSAFINRLQHDSRDDDFISDVSAFRMTQKRRKEGILEVEEQGEEEEEEERQEEQKMAVVFTGFGKDSSIEKKLKSVLRRFNLQISTEIDPLTTRCVVSRHGKRTLLVLKALCLDIPVVRPQWLEESFEDSQLLPHTDYIFPEWTLQNRRQLFSNSPGRFWISTECHPSKEDLCWMIEQCGGKITRKLHRADVIIAPENWNPSSELPTGISPEIVEELQIATPLFVIDSISAAELQEISDYLIDI